MNEDTFLREHLARLLSWEDAHVGFDAVLKGWRIDLRGRKPRGLPHTAWQLLEHMRIAQWDILEFCRDPDHISPQWPDDYWPTAGAPPSRSAWDRSIRGFRSDLQAMIDMVKDPKTELFKPLPHGEGQTILREVVLMADHNAYHLGQLVMLRRLLSGVGPR